MKKTITIDSPIGLISISEENGFISQVFTTLDASKDTDTSPLLEEAKKQLTEYFLGTRYNFDLPIKTGKTEFQENVYNALREIPYGKTKTYKEIACMINSPKAFRAVGNANNKNPLLM